MSRRSTSGYDCRDATANLTESGLGAAGGVALGDVTRAVLQHGQAREEQKQKHHPRVRDLANALSGTLAGAAAGAVFSSLRNPSGSLSLAPRQLAVRIGTQ